MDFIRDKSVPYSTLQNTQPTSGGTRHVLYLGEFKIGLPFLASRHLGRSVAWQKLGSLFQAGAYPEVLKVLKVIYILTKICTTPTSVVL